MKRYKKMRIALGAVLICTCICGCGGEKTADKEASEVIQISIAPESVTPTPTMEQIDPAAVTTNGNMTMINEYLADAPTAPVKIDRQAESSQVEADAGIENTDSPTIDINSAIGGGNAIVSMDLNK